MRLIDADYLKEHLTACAINGMPLHRMYTELDELLEVIDDVPTIEPQQKTGHWVALDDDYPEDYECDVCGFISEATFGPGGVDGNVYNYCPSCGAKMREDGDAE